MIFHQATAPFMLASQSMGCLSIPGEREVERHEWVEVKYRDLNWNKEKRKFTGFEAEILQHELDHLEGKLV